MIRQPAVALCIEYCTVNWVTMLLCNVKYYGIASRWPSLVSLAAFPPPQLKMELSLLTCRLAPNQSICHLCKLTIFVLFLSVNKYFVKHSISSENTSIILCSMYIKKTLYLANSDKGELKFGEQK